MNPEKVIPVFISSCVFVAAILIMYILSEINSSRSFYAGRRLLTQKAYDDARYKDWLERKKPELEKLYEEEFSEDMVLPFKQFCMAIYEGKEIVYKDVNRITLQSFIGIAVFVTVITWCIIKIISIW